METGIAIAVFVLALLVLPAAIRWTKRTRGPHGGTGIAALGSAFEASFDPAAARSREDREAEKVAGNVKHGENGDGNGEPEGTAP